MKKVKSEKEKTGNNVNTLGWFLFIVGIFAIAIMIFINQDAKSTTWSGNAKGINEEDQSIVSVCKVVAPVGICLGLVLICAGKMYKNNDKTVQNTNNQNDDVTVKMKQLKEMLDKNIITSEEYETKKQELLKKM